MPWTMVRPEPTTNQPPPLGTAFLSTNPSNVPTSFAPVLTSTAAFSTTIPGCPRDLELIALAECLFIDRISNLEYKIRAATGQVIFSATIGSNCCSLCGTRANRAGLDYDLVVEDLSNREVLSVTQPETPCCTTIKCLNFREEYEVRAGGGFLLGSVTEEPGCFRSQTKISVRSPDGDVKLQIASPGCASGWGCCSDIVLPVLSPDGQEVGTLKSVWRGCCSRGNTYEIVFPPGLDPITKATLFAAVFIAGHTFFENDEESD